jgi:hypothetical protein
MVEGVVFFSPCEAPWGAMNVSKKQGKKLIH